MLTLIRNARVFAPEDQGVCHVLVAGDRTEVEIRELAAIAAQEDIEEILIADCVGYERELGPMGVPRILADELKRHGRNAPLFESELEGVMAALNMTLPGDVLMLLVKGERRQSREAIEQAIAQAKSTS